MNPLWFIPAIMSVFGGVQDYQAGKDMESLARQQELMAEENAMLEQKELDENVRRQNLRDAQVRGSAQAKAAASGQRVEGSLSNYLDFIDEEQSREIDWMKTAGASRIRLNKQAANNQARSLRIQAKTRKRGLYSGLLKGASMLGAGGLFSSTAAASGAGAAASIGSK